MNQGGQRGGDRQNEEKLTHCVLLSVDLQVQIWLTVRLTVTMSINKLDFDRISRHSATELKKLKGPSLSALSRRDVPAKFSELAISCTQMPTWGPVPSAAASGVQSP